MLIKYELTEDTILLWRHFMIINNQSKINSALIRELQIRIILDFYRVKN